MTANLINTAAAGTDPVELAIENGVIVEAGEFQTIIVAAGSNIVNGQIAENEVMRCVRLGVITAVIAIHTIARSGGDFDIFNDEIANAREMQRAGAAVYEGTRLAGFTADPDGSVRGAGKIVNRIIWGIG